MFKKVFASALVCLLFVGSAFIFVSCDDKGRAVDEGAVYEVNFVLNGGLGEIGAQSVEEGDYAEKPNAPIRPGYDFIGWYLGDKKWNFYGDKVYENTELVAWWVKDDASWLSSEGLKYEWLGGGKYALVGFEEGEEKDSELVIPKMITGDHGDGVVVEIKEGAFSGEDISSVTIGSGVEVIGERAFCEASLTEVVIPDSVKEIKDEAFYNTNLNSLSISASSCLEKIGTSAFEGSSISLVSLPNSIKVIGDKAFKSAGVESLLFATNSSLVLIDEQAFYGNNISVVNIPNGTSEIGKEAFANNLNLTRVSLPVSLTMIKIDAFSGGKFDGVFVLGGKEQFRSDLFDFGWNRTTHTIMFYASYFYSELDNGTPGQWYYLNGSPVLRQYYSTISLDISAVDNKVDVDSLDAYMILYHINGAITEKIKLSRGQNGKFSHTINIYNYNYIRFCFYDASVPEEQRIDQNFSTYYTDAASVNRGINNIFVVDALGSRLVVL